MSSRSHLLDEVERVADHVAMIHAGRLVLCGAMDEVKAAHQRVTLRFEEPLRNLPLLPGVLSTQGNGRDWIVVADGRMEELRRALAAQSGRIVEETAASLEEIFIARAARRIEGLREEA